LEKKNLRTDVSAVVAAGIVGFLMIAAIWIALVFPPPIQIGGGGILSGDRVALKEHEWGFNEFAKGGPEICEVAGRNMTITIQNTGKNIHGFQIVRDGGAFVAGLNTTDLLRPGEVRQVTVKITQPGNYYYICPVHGHRAKGMFAPFVVQSGC
jgi:hypothetical protein